jgi:hypothetical protein
MQLSSLRVPNMPAWSNDPDYSPDVARALTQAYVRMARNRGEQLKWERAWAAVLPVSAQPMSLQQRLHVNFMHAAAYVEGSDYDLALPDLDRAEDLAVTLGEREARADLVYLRGVAHHGGSHFSYAIESCETYLAMSRELAATSGATDSALELDVVARLASYRAITADFEGALRSSQEADRLVKYDLPPRAVPDSARGNLLLVRAHVLRLGTPPNLADAFECAADAVEVYRAENAPASLVRARTLAADIALDRAEAYAGDRASDAFDTWMRVAESYADRALILAGQVGDDGGFGLALLSQARHRLLAGANIDTRAQVRHVVRMARNLRDPGLYAQALTGLGHDLLGRGERESALSVYRAVLKRLRDTQVAMLAIIPRDRLLRAYAP